MNNRPRTVLALVFFRLFGLDPHLPGRPMCSAVLTAQALVYIATPLACLGYAFFVLHLFADPSMLAVLSALFVGCMLGTQSLVVANALWNRRGLMVARRLLSAVDRCLAEVDVVKSLDIGK